jgi:hypothetical protein
MVLKIIAVSPNGERRDTGIEFKVLAGPKPVKRTRWCGPLRIPIEIRIPDDGTHLRWFICLALCFSL